MRLKRKTDTNKSKAYWAVIDRVIETKKSVRVGEAWTDSYRDLSSSLLDVD